jgi:Ca-activated chloride channel family protein
MRIDNGTTTGPLLRPAHVRELLQLAAEAIAVGVFASLVLGLAAFIVAKGAHAADLGGPRSGELRIAQGAGEAPVPAPLLYTDVAIDVSGIVARTRVTQRFANPGADWREGVYVFPLPEGAAVDHLEMRIGERRIEGQIRERAEARRTYEQAKREGKKAALLEQERPNLFTTSVAPIGPGEEVTVTIEYQETLRYDQGEFALRFPLAGTPRYIPGIDVETSAGGSGWAPDTDEVPDASRITPPVLHPAHGRINPVTITARIDAGFRLARLSSAYHPVEIQESASHRYTVTLRDGPVPADRDFALAWVPDVGASPGAALFVQPGADRRYALLMVVPAAGSTETARVPREATFIIDTSGSMAGTSIVQAKQALLLALDRLQGGDRFNVIEFNSHTRPLFSAPLPVDRTTLANARAFVNGLRANGGTEMRAALEAAFTPGLAPGLVRQVVFLTDGAVGNEEALFALIRERLGDRRLFTVGIGSAPNSHFMTKAALFGRGTFTYIGDVREVQQKMGALFRKLESPVLTDLAVSWPGASESWPAQLPDLYEGEPIVVTTALDHADGDVVLTGRVGGAPWRAALPLGGNGAASGVGALWARAKIDALMDSAVAGASADDVRRAVIALALEHHLVSKYTSLVAVDVTPSAPPDAVVRKTAIPTNLPHGQQYEAIFGGLPQTATPAALQALVGTLTLLGALLLWPLARRQRCTATVSRGAPPIVVAAAAIGAALLPAHARAADATGNFLLLHGNYDGDVGAHYFDRAGVSLETMPADGWFLLRKHAKGSELVAVERDARGRPAFLATLAANRLESMREPPADEIAFLRVPDANLVAGPVSEVALKRRQLVPRLDYRYTLTMGAVEFALTAHNGRNGRDGAFYTIELDGAPYQYLLPGYGFDHTIVFAGDIDRDGRPDFLIDVAASNAGATYLLLSSQAKPGMNVPVAMLGHGGC